ncbi:hypothetical protein DEI93_07750 [Curtobacterium sp. MCBD17_035]|uniref:hypothetical protein n=1 Tax=Curtobacterium sp. MCBD17_035 TaxID=2175673 RepID=UPI000DA87497|nr:hypothetical protein [Curtobacterium sp. MCBD17_035]WIB68912.1 hypothetical protein DEI93_07750 [Curtobacterium sp. MCBD17_035]
MVWDFLRGLVNAVRSDDRGGDGSYDAMQLEHFHWKCECGGHSRGGWLYRMGAEQGALMHQNRKGVGHPMPEIYSTSTG